MLGLGMVRFGLKMSFFVLTARWMYAEAALVAPSVLPSIDAALEKLSFPTHDRWGERIASARQLIHDFKAEHNGQITQLLEAVNLNEKSTPKAQGRDFDFQKINASTRDTLTRANLRLENL